MTFHAASQVREGVLNMVNLVLKRVSGPAGTQHLTTVVAPNGPRDYLLCNCFLCNCFWGGTAIAVRVLHARAKCCSCSCRS